MPQAGYVIISPSRVRCSARLCDGTCSVYTADLMSLIEQHGLSPHLYADDTQIYGSCRPTSVDAFSTKVSECVADIASWMRLCRLLLNPGKTEALWCSKGRRLHQLPTAALPIDGVPVALVPT